MSDLKMNRPDIILALRVKLPIAKAFDRTQLATHREQCAETAKKRREFLRELIKLPDAKLGEMSPYDIKNLPGGTSCPTSMVAKFEREIKILEQDTRATRIMGENDTLFFLINWDPLAPDNHTVC